MPVYVLWVPHNAVRKASQFIIDGLMDYVLFLYMKGYYKV